MRRKILRAENALRQRVEFEALVSRILSLFVRLKSGELDRSIQEALAEMGRDHEDAAPVKGTYAGVSLRTMTLSISIERIG